MPDFVKRQMALIKSQNTQRASTEGSALRAQNALWIIEISWLIERYGNRHFDKYGARSEKLGQVLFLNSFVENVHKENVLRQIDAVYG